MNEHNEHNENRSGIILVLAAFCLVMILAFAAFTVDVGYILVTKAELQNATDAATLAATQVLVENPEGGRAAVEAAVQAVVDASVVSNGALSFVAAEDLVLGNWDDETYSFVAVEGDDLTDVTAVSLDLRLSEDRDNSLNLFFAPVIGHTNVDLAASAIGAVSQDQPRDVMLVIDCSGSMANNNRMPYTRGGALLLSEQLMGEDRLGLTVYSYPQPVEPDPNDGGDDDDDGGDDDD